MKCRIITLIEGTFSGCEYIDLIVTEDGIIDLTKPNHDIVSEQEQKSATSSKFVMAKKRGQNLDLSRREGICRIPLMCAENLQKVEMCTH